MQLKNLLGSAYGRVSEAVSGAKEKAQERLVVINAGNGTLPLKWLLVAILAAFVTGFVVSAWWDHSGFRQFRAKAVALQAKKEKENQILAAELSTLRANLDAEEAATAANNRTFLDVVNSSSTANSCRVSVGPINALIVEASR